MPRHKTRDRLEEAQDLLAQDPPTHWQPRAALALLIEEVCRLRSELADVKRTALEARQAASNLDSRTRGLQRYG